MGGGTRGSPLFHHYDDDCRRLSLSALVGCQFADGDVTPGSDIKKENEGGNEVLLTPARWA